MPEKRIKLRVGLTIFAGIVILLIFIAMIGTDDYLFANTYKLRMYLNNASGLVKGAPVTLGGYKIGDVESISFVPENGEDVIEVGMRILEKYQFRITEHSHAEISSIGILGDKFVNITVGLPTETALVEGDTIPVVKSLSLDNLTEELSPGIDKLNNILVNLSTISDTIAAGKGNIGRLVMEDNLTKELEASLAKTNSLLDNINSKRGTLGKLIYDDDLYANLTGMADNMNSLIADINGGKGTLGKLVANDSLYNNLNSVSSNLNTLVEHAANDSSLINGLFTDKELYYQLKESIDNINSLVKDIQENPDKYINVSVF